jgi:hypothetical protein
MPDVTNRNRRRRRFALLATLLAVSVLAVWLRESRTAPAPVEGAPPPGWWRLAPADAAPRSSPGSADDPEALARQLSLPYAAGVVRAAGRFGVRAWDRERAAPGLNLYVSGHGAEATLMDLGGTILHRWGMPYERAFPGRPPAIDSFFYRRAALLRDGGLVAIHQGGGIVRLDARSGLVWARPAVPFNDLWVSPAEDRILFIEKLATRRPDLRSGEPVLEDWIVTLDGDGRELSRFSLLATLERSPFRALLEPLGETADILHTNTIEVLAGAGTASSGPFASGNLLVSMREIDLVAVLDAAGGSVLWAVRGPFRRQHEPSLLPDGRLLLFDNLGLGPGRSRAVAFAPASSAALDTLWPPAGLPFFSEQMGSAARLANGNLLLIESERGAAFEIDGAGRVVWEFRSPHRAGPRGELVAVLPDLVRLPATTPFLAAAAARQPL